MATETKSTTDKGVGVALGCGAIAVIGALLMIIGAPEFQAALGFGAAVLFSSIAVVAIHLWD